MFKNMKIGLRLAVSFSIMLLLIITLIAVSLNSIKKVNQNLTLIVTNETVRIENANIMKDDIREVSIALRTILLDKSKTDQEKQFDRIDSLRTDYDNTLVDYMKLIPKNEIGLLDVIAKLNVISDGSRTSNNKVIAFVKAGNNEAALDEMLNVARPRVQNWINRIVDLERLEKKSLLESFEISNSVYEKVKLYMFILGGCSVLLAVIIAFLLTVSITKPLRIATNLVISRDLAADTSGYMNGGGELGFMIQSFSSEIAERNRQEQELSTYRNQLEDMVKQRTADLSNVLNEVKESVSILAASSTQILAATTQVAAGTAETASSISETTATVEEVQQAAKQSAEIAKNVAENAQMVAKVSLDGQKAVGETIKVMSRIREQMDTIAETVVRLSEHSQSIGGIIASVTEIADQSNLLSVNAAIEAAKAGEQGKGFAVVAMEIKNMAGRSKQATNQVRNILNDVQKATGLAVMATEQGSKAVEAGVKQSTEASEAIRILTESSSEAVRAATQIVASSHQQSIGMDQIGIAMQNINQAGTETAVSMVQSEKSARNLNELGQKLKVMVEKFQV
jgi:methyl-accepting chemotaxis protein